MTRGQEHVPTVSGNDGPFATIARARDAIRDLKARGQFNRPIDVLIRNGNVRD